MEDVVEKEGRMVIFVSYVMFMIVFLCNSCFFLKYGEVIKEGSFGFVIVYY